MPLLRNRNSTYVLNHKVYCSAACLNKGDAAFAKAHAKVLLEIRHAVQLDGNQPSASCSDPAPGSKTAPPPRSSKARLQNHGKSGKEAQHTQMKQGIDARILMPAAAILETETIAYLITSIANYILKIVDELGKGTPATDLEPGAKNIHVMTLRRFPHGAEGEKEKTHVAVFNMIHALQPLFARDRNKYFVPGSLKVFPAEERIGGDVSSTAKPCTAWIPGDPSQNSFPVTEAGIIDSIDSRGCFLCNANTERTLSHNDHAFTLFVENELCERRRGCTHACTTANYTESRHNRTPQKPNYKRPPFVIGRRCTCGSM